MATKKQSKEFVDKVAKELVSMGAIATDRDYEWLLATKVGEMWVKVDPDSKHCFSVFCRFKDVDRAKAQFGCNVYSGKFNSHIGAVKGLTVDKAVELSLFHLKQTL